ncbi:hypothetical protein [Roseibium aggregatum]|uniref:Secreted protein n=1 Tax=Roseibium aggregatum TaxID=187304 RepID=A0A939EGF4_9HYPH|nr:hypothetical protein [Roseibium aggregatum]MBN9672680.1 hypothetical protein [Roseibium aggregatum]
MKTNLLAGITFAATLLTTIASHAATVSPVFTDEGIDTTGTATSTRMYRADLTGLGLSKIGSVTLKDSNSGVGGSSGIYSGFDLDAVFLDVDGLLSTDTDRYYANSFLFTAGTTRSGSYAGPSPSGGPTNGSSDATTVDESWATLNDIDGLYFSTGSLTFGDGGILTAIFSPEITVGSSLFLFAGEVSGDPGETLTGLVEISDTTPVSAVPLPAALPLLAGSLGLFGMVSARRKRTAG